LIEKIEGERKKKSSVRSSGIGDLGDFDLRMAIWFARYIRKQQRGKERATMLRKFVLKKDSKASRRRRPAAKRGLGSVKRS